MTSIKEILENLVPAQRGQLEYAFENELINQYVEYSPGRFIGVNINGLPNLHIEQTAGYYASGIITQGQGSVLGPRLWNSPEAS